MKKLLLSIFAVCAISTLSFAQDFTYGAKVGISMSSVSIADIDGVSVEKDMRTSLNFGGFAKFQMSSWMALQGEVLYSMQGAKLKWITDGTGYSGKLKLNYLSIPIMAKFYMFEGVFAEVGPQVAFLLKKECEDDLASYKSGFDFRTVDLDINMGLGYEFEMGLMLGARYSMGTIDAIKDKKSKNGVLSVYAGWAF